MGTPAFDPKSLPARTALLVDSDLGFIFWLARTLDVAGYEALPAKSVADAISLVTENRLMIDVVLVNTALPDADRLVEFLKNLRNSVKIIGVAASADATSPAFPVDALRTKPEHLDDDSRWVWVRFIQAITMDRAPGQ